MGQEAGTRCLHCRRDKDSRFVIGYRNSNLGRLDFKPAAAGVRMTESHAGSLSDRLMRFHVSVRGDSSRKRYGSHVWLEV